MTQPMLTEETIAGATPHEIVEALLQPLESHRVYLAGGLFTDEEKAVNLRLTEELEHQGYSVFLPQRDGYVAATLEGLSDAEKVERIYRRDLAELCRARFLLANLNGAVPDDGVCGEVGIAGVLKLLNPAKQVVAFRSDTRTWMHTMKVNPLIAGPLDALYESVDELMEYFASNAPVALPGEATV